MTESESSHHGGTIPDLARALGAAKDLLRERRYGEAEALYRAILREQPANFEVVHNLGLVLLQLNELDAGLGMLRHALALHPHSAEALNNIGGALQAMNRQEEALGEYRKALAIRPGYADAHNNLGTALRTLGRIGEALGAFETAISLAPDRPTFYRSLVESKRIVAGDPIVAALETLLPRIVRLPLEEQIQLRFALGKAYDDSGEHARSFHHLEVGNELRRQQIIYDEAETLHFMERIRRVFTSDLLRQKGMSADPSELPVFIVGMPRSGTTLVEQILSSHPQIHGGGESTELHALATSLAGGYPEAVPRLDSAELTRLGTRYLERLGRPDGPIARITDKMPLNFRHLGLIRLALPNARIIHVRRDPLDTCLSCFSILFTGSQPYTYDLGELGRFYRAYEQLMEHWRRVLPAGIMIEVTYEDIVADFENQAKRMIAHCGLAWHDNCRAFHTTERKVRTASAAQVRRPLYRESVGRAAPYRRYLRPLIEALGER